MRPPRSTSSGRSTEQGSKASGQRGWKAQPGGGVIGLGISPSIDLARPPAHAEVGQGVDQQARVGMARAREQLAGGASLDDAAQIHDADARRHVPHHRQVVADEQVGEPETVLQVAHQVEDLRLHRNVERAGRLVADDELGVRRQGAGDADALALAAGELVRILAPVGGIEADQAQQLAHALLDLGAVLGQPERA